MKVKISELLGIGHLQHLHIGRVALVVRGVDSRVLIISVDHELTGYRLYRPQLHGCALA